MNTSRSKLTSRPVQLLMLCALAGGAYASRNLWWTSLNTKVDQMVGKSATAKDDHAHDEHGHDDHAHAGHEEHAAHAEVESLELSTQAMKNLGLTAEFLKPITTATYYRTISVPAVIVERPGRTVLQVSTPMTGVVTQVSAVPGSAVEPGAPLFQIRLTHEELVASQSEFVRALGELDVEERELKRLQAGVDSGVIPPRSVLEHQYAKEKLEALLGAQREALRLHGLSERQVSQIEKDRRLLSELSVTVPENKQIQKELKLTGNDVYHPVAMTQNPAAPLIIESMDVQHGQSIEQGGKLCSLADYSRLYIEGRAFEQDADVISKATANNWKAQALFSDGIIVNSLPISFIASEIDENARTLKFFVDLENEIIRDHKDEEGNRFVSWKYKPGQRLQLMIPVEEWKDQIVVPVDAVAQEGAESFVFQQNGDHFDRIPVHVIHKDQSSVVLANDGALFPGDVIALRNAHQMQMAVRNKAGGGIDPHAGHSH
jgi:multidrug efflux pump subunit AcrA (membrane-fusion protein)